MVVLLKMFTTGKILGKICLKAKGDTFFPICMYVVRNKRRDKKRRELNFLREGTEVRGEHPTKG